MKIMLTCALAVALAQQAPASPPASNPSFRSGISYIEVDASVLDRNRNPVRGLTAGNFTVLEDGHAQQIVTFSEVTVPDPTPPPVAWMRDVTPDVQSNDAPIDGRVVVLLLDERQAPTDRTEGNSTRQIAKMIIDRLGPADRAAVLFVKIAGSQDFTNDHAKLQAAVDAFVPFTPPDGAGGVDRLRSSLDRIETITENLGALQGKRKALFYFGVKVPMPIPNERDASSPYEYVKRIFRKAQQANVNIYPIDPSGLGGLDDFGMRPGLPTQSFALDSFTEFYQTFAKNTGGIAIVNRSDFDTVVPRILREDGTYYLLGYQSPNSTMDGALRSIKVSVNRPGVTVRARSGYYATKTNPPANVPPDPNALSPALETVATALTQNPAVRMQVSAATFAIAERPGAAVAITLGVRPEVVEDRTQVDEVELLAEAFTPEGVKAAFTRQPFRINAGALQYELLTRLDLKPGRYQLRVSTESKLRGKAGSVFTDLDVPDFSKPLSLSGVIVHAEPGPLTRPNAGVAALAPAVPTTLRDFSTQQQVTAFLRIYQGGNGALVSIPLSVRIRDVHDAVVFDAPQTLTADRFDATRAAEYRLELPISQLPPGPYLLSIEGTLKKDTLRRNVKFQVH